MIGDGEMGSSQKNQEKRRILNWFKQEFVKHGNEEDYNFIVCGSDVLF